MIKGVCVWCRVTSAERQRREVTAEIGQPAFEDIRRYEVDLVEDEDQTFLASVSGHDGALDVAGAGAFGVAGVEDVEDYVSGIDDLLEHFVERTAGGVFGDVGGGFVVFVFFVVVLTARVTVFGFIFSGAGTGRGEESGHGGGSFLWKRQYLFYSN